MSTPGISGINGAARVGSATADAPASTPASAVRASSAASLVEIDETTQLPKAPRFPWLSRVSAELESASQRRPGFSAAPVLGDHVDQSV